MEIFAEKFKNTTLQPQVFSLILVTLILVTFAIFVYHKVKKQKPNTAPDGFVLLTEQYVMGVDNLFNQTTGGALKKPAPYIFTLLTFLMVSNLMGLIGLEPPSSSYSFTLTLALVSWVGIFVVGLTYQKLRFFNKFKNPLEIVGQIAPLISLSFRLFGNMIGGATIMYLIYAVCGSMWGMIPVIGDFNLLGAAIAPVFHMYFDIFDGLVQGLVFSMLTMVYWTLEAHTPTPKVKKVKKSEQAEVTPVSNVVTTN